MDYVHKNADSKGDCEYHFSSETQTLKIPKSILLKKDTWKDKEGSTTAKLDVTINLEGLTVEQVVEALKKESLGRWKNANKKAKYVPDSLIKGTVNAREYLVGIIPRKGANVEQRVNSALEDKAREMYRELYAKFDSYDDAESMVKTMFSELPNIDVLCQNVMADIMQESKE